MAHIQRLRTEVAAQIEASASLFSLNDVIVGLLENALDAGAQKIDIKVDFTRASCWIQDDGSGIAASNFAEDGGLCEPFHTSNTHSGSDLSSHNGLFLASVAAVSVLSITSRCQSAPEANALVLRYAQSVTRLLPAPEHMSLELGDHGTKVSMHDLFGNMPVRVKQRPTSDDARSFREKEWNRLCIAVAGCILAYGKPLHLNMRGGDGNHIFKIKTNQATPKKTASLLATNSRLSFARSVLQQSFPSTAASAWIPISARTSTLKFQAIIYSDPVPRRHLQFICIGDRYMPPDGNCEMLYESINQVFSNSAFGKVDLEDHTLRAELCTKRQQQANRPSFKHWPAFVILIRLDNSDNTYNTGQKDFLTRLSEIATALATRFLTEHGYQPKRSTRSRQEVPSAQQQLGFDTAPLNVMESTSNRMQSSTTKCASPNAPFQDLNFDIKLPINRAIPSDIILKDDPVFRSRFVSSRNVNRPHLLSSYSAVTMPKEIHTGRHTARTPEPKEPTIDTLQIGEEGLGFVSARDNTGSSIIQDCQAEENQDESFQWTDPKTRRTFCINARTGYVIKSGDCQRPGTTNDSISQLAQSRSLHGNLPRLTRSANGIVQPKDGSWAKRFFDNWQNPVLENVQANTSISEFDFHDLTRLAPNENDGSSFSHTLKNGSIQSEVRLQKAGLRNAAVISQVDSKFILITMPGRVTDRSKDIVVLIDQHAADERVRAEQLFKQLCSAPSQEVMAYVSPLRQRSAIDTVILQQPVVIEVQAQEHELFKRNASFFAEWGILYNISRERQGTASIRPHDSCHLTVLSLPSGIAQRCSTEPRLLLNLLRSEIWKDEERAKPKHDKPHSIEASWVTKLHNCPSGIVDLLNSRACRSAVMFNDILTLSECKKIVSDLAECQFPFQCAHGRPSMVPLLHLNNDTTPATTATGIDEPNDFSKAWKTWIGRE